MKAIIFTDETAYAGLMYPAVVQLASVPFRKEIKCECGCAREGVTDASYVFAIFLQ